MTSYPPFPSQQFPSHTHHVQLTGMNSTLYQQRAEPLRSSSRTSRPYRTN